MESISFKIVKNSILSIELDLKNILKKLFLCKNSKYNKKTLSAQLNL